MSNTLNSLMSGNAESIIDMMTKNMGINPNISNLLLSMQTQDRDKLKDGMNGICKDMDIPSEQIESVSLFMQEVSLQKSQKSDMDSVLKCAKTMMLKIFNDIPPRTISLIMGLIVEKN